VTAEAGAHPDGFVLRVEGLAAGYGGLPVLGGVDLVVRPGERWFLLGPNGSGKTTLLRVVLGLLPPTRGRVVRNPVHAAPPRIGFVPQRPAAPGALPITVREFVALGFVASRVRRRDRGRALRETLARLGLSERARVPYDALSGGQQRRALLARAMVRDPDLLVLDEPTEGLDPSAQAGFLALLDELQRARGITVLFVTHDLEVARGYATHVALFHRGRVHAGPSHEVLRPETLETVFGLRSPTSGGTA